MINITMPINKASTSITTLLVAMFSLLFYHAVAAFTAIDAASTLNTSIVIPATTI